MDDDECRKKTPDFVVRETSPYMPGNDGANGPDERLLVFVRVVALLNAFSKMLLICTVGCPGEHRLVMLIHARIVCAYADADPVDDGIKTYFGKGVPSSL